MLHVRVVEQANACGIRRILVGFLDTGHSLGVTDTDGLSKFLCRNIFDTFQGTATTRKDDAAIDKGIHFAYRSKQNGVVELSSLQFPKRAQWHIREIGEKTGDWADYLRGATWALAKEHSLMVGLCGVIEGSLPIGGLSSSAAVILAFLDALANVNGPPQRAARRHS